AAKAVVAATILLPPAFLMGGTLPLMGQFLVRSREQLGTMGSALYAVNTAGGAAGALAAGFVLPPALGFTGAYTLAIGIDVMVGGTALLMARGQWEPAGAGSAEGAGEVDREGAGKRPREGTGEGAGKRAAEGTRERAGKRSWEGAGVRAAGG